MTQVTEKTTSSGERGVQNRHPTYSTPTLGTYSSPRTFLTGTLAFDSPPLVSGLRSYPGTLSHFSFQPGSGEYGPGMLTFDGSARDAEVRINVCLACWQARLPAKSMMQISLAGLVSSKTSHGVTLSVPPGICCVPRWLWSHGGAH